MAKENREVVRRLYEDCLNAGRVEDIPALVSADFVGPSGERGPDGFRAITLSLRAAFPDIHFTLEDMAAEGDRVAVRWTWRGTHRGRFRAFAATQKPVTNDGIAFYQVEGGRIVRSWLQTDRLGFLQQIGAVPADLGAPPPASSGR